VLILAFGSISGAHFNPVVSLADWFVGCRDRTGLTLFELVAYMAAQVAGAVGGSVLANLMFEVPTKIATTSRDGAGHFLGELVATSGLLIVIFSLARTHRAAIAAPAVGAYIGAAYWFTSSTSFANPAVTIGRIFSDTFAGIAPASVPAFIGAQLVGAVIGVAITLLLFPTVGRSAGDVVVPSDLKNES
jgi:glycerol uptake facilitator-like aquaporin